MILIVLVISLVALLISFIFKPHNHLWLSASGISLTVLILCLVAIVGNVQYHWGMTKQTVSQTVAVQLAQHKLTYVALGTGNKEPVYVYSTSAKRNQQTDPEHDTVKTVRSSVSEPELKTMRDEYQYTNSGRFWFGLAGKDNRLIKCQQTFTIPTSYQVIQSGRKTF